MSDIVRIALQRPYTFVVMALLLALSGIFSALRIPADILPAIRILAMSVVWQYTGLSPDEMAGGITSLFQRLLTTTVSDIEHIEATSITGIGLVRIFSQPGVDIATANAQVSATAPVAARHMPAGTTNPLILSYDASTVPIVQVALSGKGLTEMRLPRPMWMFFCRKIPSGMMRSQRRATTNYSEASQNR